MRYEAIWPLAYLQYRTLQTRFSRTIILGNATPSKVILKTLQFCYAQDRDSYKQDPRAW